VSTYAYKFPVKPTSCPKCGSTKIGGGCYLPGLDTPEHIEYSRTHAHMDFRCHNRECKMRLASKKIEVVEVEAC